MNKKQELTPSEYYYQKAKIDYNFFLQVRSWNYIQILRKVRKQYYSFSYRHCQGIASKIYRAEGEYTGGPCVIENNMVYLWSNFFGGFGYYPYCRLKD